MYHHYEELKKTYKGYDRVGSLYIGEVIGNGSFGHITGDIVALKFISFKKKFQQKKSDKTIKIV